MERVGLILVAGLAGGLLAKKVGLPGGPVVGSMLGSGLLAVILPGSYELPESVSTAVQIMLGISLGISFDRSMLLIGGRLLPLAMLSTLVLLVTALGMAWLAQHFGVIDVATALFGFSPGGMSGMSLLAQAEGYRAPVVAFLHTVRIFTLFLVVPLLGRLLLVKVS